LIPATLVGVVLSQATRFTNYKANAYTYSIERSPKFPTIRLTERFQKATFTPRKELKNIKILLSTFMEFPNKIGSSTICGLKSF
jgi:hypothetical protein